MNATYIGLIWELIAGKPREPAVEKVRRAMLLRSTMTLCLFAIAVAVSLRYPLVGLVICIGCLIVYLRPDPPEVPTRVARR